MSVRKFQPEASSVQTLFTASLRWPRPYPGYSSTYLLVLDGVYELTAAGQARIIASVEDPAVIGRILVHLEQTKQARGSAADLATAHRARGPPGQRKFDLN
jgi:hypothetical protein